MKTMLSALMMVLGLASSAWAQDPSLVITDPYMDYLYFQWDEVSTDITVEFQIENWELSAADGKLVRFYLDGEEQGVLAEGNSFQFTKMPHGEHQLCCAMVEQGNLLDSCLATDCVYVRVQRTCSGDGDPICDDGNPCSLDGCIQGVNSKWACRYGTPVGQVGCCQSDLDCPCVKFGADSFFLGCGWGNSCDPCQNVYCDDGNACTEDSCDPGTGGCRHLPDANLKCCSGDPDPACDDGNVCTQDRCIAKACHHGPVSDPLCCNNDSECDDGNPCTDDLCREANQCQYIYNDHANCCSLHSECGPGGPWDDGDPNTTDYCQNFQCVHVMHWEPCEDYCEEWDDDPCTEAACVDETCQLLPVPGCGTDVLDSVDETVSDVDAGDGHPPGPDAVDIAQDLVSTDTAEVTLDLAAPDAPHTDQVNPTDLPQAKDTQDADAATERPSKKASSGCNSGGGGGGAGGLLLALALAILTARRRARNRI